MQHKHVKIVTFMFKPKLTFFGLFLFLKVLS